MAKNVQRESKFPGLMKNIPTSTPTPIHEYTHEHTHKPTQVTKELKTKRVYLLLKPSTVERLEVYTKANGISKNNVIETLIEDFLADK